MEEDIKILENFFENRMDVEEEKWALENLLTRYKKLEENNKKLKTIKGFEEENIEVSKFGEWVGKDYIDYKFEYENYQKILADSIPKSKVKEKIEELDNKGEHYIFNEKDNAVRIGKIEVLQELLGEEK